MQFVANGPEIPETLLQAHEDGRVVFFCGAGISYPAGLPGFKGLVDDIYKEVGTSRSPIEDEAYVRNQFDATLDLLERRLPGQRLAVRRALAKVLQPKLRRKGATDTHDALLELSRTADESIRLVTTNFDHIFERVAKRKKLSVMAYPAPLLPIPKNSRWSGIVYLHGLLPGSGDDDGLQRLVVTSGDFGLAYLTERWAARFVSELFRNYVVCFVGYSINDPVLRYMMDALAADRMLGELTPQAYALGDYSAGNEHAKRVEWEAKGVTPILYEVPSGTRDHSALHNTLKAWASTYRDGSLGKERIVVDYPMARPSASTRQDDFVGRMLWALSDSSALPAKRFAEFNPAPALDWLQAFDENRYRHCDLERFGIPSNAAVDDKLSFSLVHRPTPYPLAPWMSLTHGHKSNRMWDDLMFQLARWLIRHLDDPDLILWAAGRGGDLHERFLWIIESHLDRIFRLERDGNSAELDEIRSNSPNAIPRPEMRVLWRLLLTGCVKKPWLELELYHWKDQLKREGLTTTLRLAFREILAPKISLRKPFRWPDDKHEESPERIRDFVEWELVLNADHVHSSLRDLSTTEEWQAALPLLLGDIERLLQDALDLLIELGEATDQEDRSSWDMPSISEHWQNRGFQDWAALIEMLRDAWMAVRKTNSLRATQIAEHWFSLPYATFKRLALFAASQDHAVPPAVWVDWLSQDTWWLWSVNTKRETMRLLVLQGSHLTPEIAQKLEQAILEGPPRSMYRDDIDPERWNEIVDQEVWLRLAKLRAGRGALEDAAQRRFRELSSANPSWQLADNERDEFWHWMSGTGDPDYESRREVDVAPRTRTALVSWLERPVVERGPTYEDTWSGTCRDRFYVSFAALCDLADRGVWPADRWRDALQAWSDTRHHQRSWKLVPPLVHRMPEEVFSAITRAVAWWLDAVSKGIHENQQEVVALCRRIFTSTEEEAADTELSVSKAINHPVGLATQALLSVWFDRKPNDNDALPEDLAPIFTELCDRAIPKFGHARVILASRLIALFRVDRPWTEEHLLPLFDWSSNSTEAKAAWEGFLWSPRLHWPLLTAIKPDLLSTANHYADLGEPARIYAQLITYAALEPSEDFAFSDFETAIGTLPQEGLEEVVQSVAQALEGAGDKRDAYWENRVKPFWKNVWPKSRDLASNRISEALARLIIAASDAFPDALDLIGGWLLPIEHPHYVVSRLEEAALASRFPREVIEFLDLIIRGQPWPPRELRRVLAAVIAADPNMAADHRYRRLDDYARQHGT